MELTDIIIRIRGANIETVSKASADSFDERPVSVDGGLKNVTTHRTKIRKELGSNEIPTHRQNRSHPGYQDSGTVMTDSVKKETSDVNSYQYKKTLAQGMMDLALLSANANQLRYVLESYKNHTHFYPTVTFIAISIVLQVVVGVGLILNSRYNIKNKREMRTANRINNFTTIGVFLVTVVNLFVCAIGVADSPDDTSDTNDHALNSTVVK